MGFKNQPRSIRFHHYTTEQVKNRTSRSSKQQITTTSMTINNTLKQQATERLGNITRNEHNYSMQIATLDTIPGRRNSKEQSGTVKEIGKILSRETERIQSNDKLSRDKFDMESLQSFHDYARYLELVNPICSPDAVDTADKLIYNLGI